MAVNGPMRRRWLAGALGVGTVGAAGCSAPRGPTAAESPREWRGTQEPFTLGVASGMPRSDGVTLWTRLAPQPLEAGGGLDPVTLRVRWEVRDEDRGGPPVATGEALADPAWAHSVRVDVRGLDADRRYRYRFASGAATSAEGRFRTAPTPGPGGPVRLLFAACQHYEQGTYVAWRHAVDEAPDLVVFLGDYIYEASTARQQVRRHAGGTARALADYRQRYAQYRTDPDLQAAHAACAWVITWDDHEVDNDYAADLSQNGEPPEQFLRRRAAAYRAWFEHMPVPWSMAPSGPALQLYGHVDWGAMLRLHVLDDRQYRSPQACSPPGRAGSRIVGSECAQRFDPARTMLGAPQEAWFDASMRGSRARWNVVAQQTLIGPAATVRGTERRWWTDGWDGYPFARQRLLQAVRSSGASNPIALGGDVHTFYAGELHEDFERPAPRPVMVELVGGSITSRSWPQAMVDQVVAANPNLRWGDGRFRGYGRLDLAPGSATVALRVVADAADPNSPIRTLRTFTIREGEGRLEG